MHNLFKRSMIQELYFDDPLDFDGIRLKFLARTGMLPLEGNRLVKHYSDNNGICKRCNSEIDILEHFFFKCKLTSGIMNELYIGLKEIFGEKYNDVYSDFIRGCNKVKLNFLLGDIEKEYGKVVAKYFDQLSKDFLKKAWELHKMVLENG